MADNVTLNAGSGGDTIAADDVGGVKYQIVKLATGALDSAVLSLNGSGTSTGAIRVELPTNGTGIIAGITNVVHVDDNSGSLTVDGSVSMSGSVAVTDNGGNLSIDDGGNSITVDYATTGNGGASGALRVAVSDIGTGEYETVAASQTAQVLGATGGTGDFLMGVLIIPATTSPGAVSILDNATSITIFTGGASSVSNLVPFMVPLGIYSVSGAWKVTTGANVSAIGIGNFT